MGIKGWPPKSNGLYFDTDMVLDPVSIYKANKFC